ncbi:MAG: hypothetical protein ACLQNV_07360 [Steroidobacteraceae bacterium]
MITFLLIAYLVGINAMPRDIVQASFALGAAVLFGLGFALLNVVIALAFPAWLTGYALLTIILWLTSGVYFVPDALPAITRDALAYQPATQVIEWMRAAYYEGYGSAVLGGAYVIGWGIVTVFLGLLLERAMRGHLLAVR